MKNEELTSAAVFCPIMFEGQPRAMVEAMASSLPIIGTDVMGIVHDRAREDHLRDGRHKRYKLFAQPELMHKLGVAARQFAMENFSLDHIAQREILERQSD